MYIYNTEYIINFGFMFRRTYCSLTTHVYRLSGRLGNDSEASTMNVVISDLVR